MSNSAGAVVAPLVCLVGVSHDTCLLDRPNDLNISGVQTGTATTNSAGQFMDTFFVCTALCPQSTGTTAASQTITDAPPNGGSFSLSANGIAYKCGGITINGQ